MRVAAECAVLAGVCVEPRVTLAVLPAVVAMEEVWDEPADEVVTVVFREPEAVAEVVPLVLAVPLLTRVKRGVKLYASGPTFETFEAGPMIIWIA